MNRRPPRPQRAIAYWRYLAVAGGLVALPVLALWQTASLQVQEQAERGARFLQDRGEALAQRSLAIPAYRGLITDRRGEPLAVSTSVVTLWADPRALPADAERLAPLARLLGVPVQDLLERRERNAEREFMFLARQWTPADAAKVLALNIPGVNSREEFKRYYPAGEVTAQLIGFTNVDDHGQEGIELAYDHWLAGAPGERRVVRDRKGQVIKDIELVRSEKPGNDLALSIDLRLQYLAYRELRAALETHRAAAGCVVMLSARTGEVLALVNQPSFNPNDRGRIDNGALRNRALTDQIEPGSTMKPFTMVAALESGRYRPDTPIDTAPGWIHVGRKTYRDHHNYGLLDLTGVLAKSSQVGTTKVSMTLEPERIRDVFDRVGLGQPPGTGFPGENAGSVPNKRKWALSEHAALAFGYGMTATPLQLAAAYSVLANRGMRQPVTLLRRDGAIPADQRQQVIAPAIADQVRTMMKAVVENGTATRAAIPVYAAAGKTGTSHKVGAGGYQANRYLSLFVGMAPADDPELITVVVVDDPRAGGYFGGLVAAPVFSAVTSGALRLFSVAPPQAPQRIATDASAVEGVGDGEPAPGGAG
ncbi:MAG: penicillin-binding protein 3 [Porticoccaceae bacterium]